MFLLEETLRYGVSVSGYPGVSGTRGLPQNRPLSSLKTLSSALSTLI